MEKGLEEKSDNTGTGDGPKLDTSTPKISIEEPQSPADDADGFKDIFKRNKSGSESRSSWYVEENDDSADTTRLTPSGAARGADAKPLDDKYKYEYNMEHARRGVAHVFVNKHFDEVTEQTMRTGAEHDLNLYKDTFVQLGFEVKRYLDSTREQIINELRNYAAGDHSREDAVIFAFSSHGEQAELAKQKGIPRLAADIIYAKDAYLTVAEVADYLTEKRCPTMANKPKLFFFQACRGQQLGETIAVSNTGMTLISDDKVLSTATRPVQVPLHKDFFMAFSAPPGYFSFRRSKGSRAGSWFVLALHDIIRARAEKKAEIDMMEVVTALNHRMTLDESHEFISNMKSNPIFHKRMIVPWVASMLTKSLCFRPPGGKS